MENRQIIEKYSFFVENDFSEDHFFKDVLVACYEKRFLDEAILKRISYERLDILKTQLKYYTKDESSSVMVEVAENLMEGIDYTLGFYLKTFNTLELIIERLKNESLSHMLETGRNLIKETIEESKKLLEDIMENKLKVNNYSYDDTIDHGISLFFEEYEYFFAPHEGSGSIDYQLYMDNMNYKGIEYIRNYLKILSLENEFCSNFNISEINELLKGYDKSSEELLINVFELVLINSLGLIICGKSLSSLNINSADREVIKNKLKNLSAEKLQEEVLKGADKCCKILSIKNKELIAYVRKSAIKLTDWLYESIKVNRLETVFISLDKNEDDEFMEYIDGEKLSNAEFKNLSEEIRECSLIQDKIKLIKNNIKSLEDMVDMLNAECLFEGEYIALFKSLSKVELILITKHISDLNFDRDYAKEWYYEFKNYILSLDEKDRESIGEFKERIRVI